MSQNEAPIDNGWIEKGTCCACGWIGSKRHVCPACGAYHHDMGIVVVRWVSTLKWYHFFTAKISDRGYWEKKK